MCSGRKKKYLGNSLLDAVVENYDNIPLMMPFVDRYEENMKPVDLNKIIQMLPGKLLHRITKNIR